MNASIPNETQYNYHDPYNLTAGISISVLGTFGITCNATLIYIYCTNRSERNSFNTICNMRAAVNLYILTVLFAIVFLPTTLLGYTPIFSTPVSACLIASGNGLYAMNENLTLLSAINRCCAIFLPLRYTRLCGMKPTVVCLVCLLVYRIGKLINEMRLSLFTDRECWLYFSPNKLVWKVTKGEGCTMYDDAIPPFVVLFICTTSLNAVTFLKIICFYRKKSQLDKTSRSRERKNIRLFFQTVLQDLIYLVDLTFTFKLSGLVVHRLWSLLSGTLIWESLHSFDGFVMLVFTERFNLLKACLPSISAPPSLVTVPSKNRIFSTVTATASIN